MVGFVHYPFFYGLPPPPPARASQGSLIHVCSLSNNVVLSLALNSACTANQRQKFMKSHFKISDVPHFTFTSKFYCVNIELGNSVVY